MSCKMSEGKAWGWSRWWWHLGIFINILYCCCFVYVIILIVDLLCRRWQSVGDGSWDAWQWSGVLLWVAGWPLWPDLEWAEPHLCGQCCRGWLPTTVGHDTPSGEVNNLVSVYTFIWVQCLGMLYRIHFWKCLGLKRFQISDSSTFCNKCVWN